MDFIIGKEYKRSDLHNQWGGSRQSGISPSGAHPIIFLFTGESGHQYGYQDGFQGDGIFWYTGEGQVGDMVMIRGNLAIQDSLDNGRVLHLFEQTRKAYVRYMGEASYLGHHEALSLDRNGRMRTVIVFELGLKGELSEGSISNLVLPIEPFLNNLWKLSLADLRRRTLASVSGVAPVIERRANVQVRSEAIRVYVRKRANGRCEGCEQPAPFMAFDGQLYLEPHHIRRLADGGPDHPRWVAALCPNCHRRVHHGKDGRAYNEMIANKVTHKERAS